LQSKRKRITGLRINAEREIARFREKKVLCSFRKNNTTYVVKGERIDEPQSWSEGSSNPAKKKPRPTPHQVR